MSKWVFLEDFDLKPAMSQGINLGFASSVALRIEDAQLVIFSAGAAHTEPHVLSFQSKALCQTAYDIMKLMLKAEK